MTNTIINLPITSLIGGLIAYSTAENRYYLTGVYIERLDSENIRLVSTDGLIMILTDIKGIYAEFKPFIIPPALIGLLAKLKNKKAPLCELIIDDAEYPGITINYNRQSVSDNAIEGQFPAYKRCVPSISPDNSIASFAFNPDLITRLGKAFDIITGKKGEGIQFLSSANNLDPFIVHPNIEQKGNFTTTGVIMPMRCAL